MEQNTSNNRDTSISLWDLLNKLVEKCYIIAITVAAFLAVAFIYVQFIATPMYSSTAKIFIFNADNGKQNSSEFSISTYLTHDYIELITDRSVLENVADNLNLEYNYATLKSLISINNPADTRILEISVKSPDATLSKRIADEICTVSQAKLIEIMGVERVNIISNAYVANSPVEPVMSQSLIIAVGLALIISVAVILLLYILGDKLETAEDIEKHLGISVLAEIPYSNTVARKNGKYSSGKKVRRK